MLCENRRNQCTVIDQSQASFVDFHEVPGGCSGVEAGDARPNLLVSRDSVIA